MLPHPAYRAGIRLCSGSLPLAARWSTRARRAVADRTGILERFATWGKHQRDHARQLIWFHAASTGEGLHAKPVIEELRARHPKWQIFYTHFSSSAAEFVQHLDVDGTDYLPFDRAHDVHRTFEALQPDMLVFAAGDVWPWAVAASHERRTPVALVSAAVSESSRRLRGLGPAMLWRTYRSLDFTGAVSVDDERRLATLGVRPERILVTGNTRFDSARARSDQALLDPWASALRSERPTLIAGSTWAEDEAVLLQSFSRIRQRHTDTRLIIAPHEPTADRVRALRERANALHLTSVVTLDDGDGWSEADIVIIDRVGHLAEIYAVGQVAYVGGGFGKRGLHSVIEPAACSLPVIVGPRWQGSSEAVALQSAGAIDVLPHRDATSTLEALWGDYVESRERRAARGGAGRRKIEEGAGASAHTADALDDLMERTRQRAKARVEAPRPRK